MEWNLQKNRDLLKIGKEASACWESLECVARTTYFSIDLACNGA